MAAKQVKGKGTRPDVSKNRSSSDLQPIWRRQGQWSRMIGQYNTKQKSGVVSVNYHPKCLY